MTTLVISDPLTAAHPWLQLEVLSSVMDSLADGTTLTLRDEEGCCFGTGVFDRRDPIAAWRRFTWESGVEFDERYLLTGIEEAIESRSDEACQCLVASDADYLPGLTAELYGDVLLLRIESSAVAAHEAWLVDYFNDTLSLREIVIENRFVGSTARTTSGNNLKPFWCTFDDLEFRLDLLNSEKPRFPLDLREQHALVGSLCKGRRVLDLGSGMGGFSLQASRMEADQVIAVDACELSTKGIRACAQKNGLSLDALAYDPVSYLKEIDADCADVVILNPEIGNCLDVLQRSNAEALRVLGSGGILATYCRSTTIPLARFENLIAEAFRASGREGRLFARVAQPFDFPIRMNFPESQGLKGLILEVPA